MSATHLTAIGAPVDRVDGPAKVAGEAPYALEHDVGRAAHAVILCADIARGEVRAVDASAARAADGVLEVLTHLNAPRLATGEGELGVLQSPRVAYRGQIVGAVVAETIELAREAARRVRITYAEEEHDVVLRVDHPRLYRPEQVNPSYPADTAEGDVDAALQDASVAVDATYRTPAYHNNPMEPHATIALWEGRRLTVYDSTQGAYACRQEIAERFGLDPSNVRVIAPHVGGGFGSKGRARPHTVVAAMAADLVGRPVKVAVTRQQMFAFTGYRTPTIQRVRLAADGDGRLTAIAHDVVEQTSTVQEFAEQTAVVTRMMYAAPNRRTSHRLVRLDVPTPSWMRAPGECPGMYALESAMDELALAAGIDPIELRARNEPDCDPESRQPFSSRNLVACMHRGAELFGWSERDPRPCSRRDGRWLIGTGMAASTYPARRRPATATARAEADGSYTIEICAEDIGTGARTVLTQLAADALGVGVERVRIEVGDSDFGSAPVAGGSAGTSSWGTAVIEACGMLRDGRSEVTIDTAQTGGDPPPLSTHAFGAQFVEVRIDSDTGEVRVPRALGVFAAGRILNPKTARSQFIGGMTMGLSMALLEESRLDARFGDYLNHDLAQYHVPVNADIAEIEAHWIPEDDPHVNAFGAKGIGEIGIVGTAAAVTNAIHHATGIRLRDLPITPDRLVPLL